MRLEKLHIKTRFKNLNNLFIDFSDKSGITVLIGNNGTGKSNILEAISSIFAGLYHNNFRPTFEYELSYSINSNNIHITYENNNYVFQINGQNDNMKYDYLPTQVISSYSGEENRLWKEYYKPFYDEYVKAIRGAAIPDLNLIFINKQYWNIAILTFYYYDFEAFTDIAEFCKKTLGISTINSIVFRFDKDKLESWAENPIVTFVKAINPDIRDSVTMTLEELKRRVSYIGSERDFFRYLVASNLPENNKLITNITINFNDVLTTESLSEGEKKLTLVKLILEVIGDENSLILLDEPDSQIHVSRKEELKNLLKQYQNRENVITTHSPTLAHCFHINNILMLSRDNNGDAIVEEKDKQEIVYRLTNGIWSYMEQNIFLNSNRDILLVEGKSDEIFLKKALEVLKRTELRYSNLEFEYLPCGGADYVKLLVDKFRPKVGQTIIAFFDRDEKGWKCINAALGVDDVYNSTNFANYKKRNDIWIAAYPIRSHFRGTNFNIEDYFIKSVLHKYVNNYKSIHEMKTQKYVKDKLTLDCTNFDPSEFRLFKKVFDLILEIKSK